MNKLFLFSATQFEIIPTLEYLDENWTKKSFFEYRKGDYCLFPIVTGVGSMLTALAMSRTKDVKEAALVINAGLAGSFSEDYPIGTVVEVIQDRFADLGVEENDGSFTDVHELDLLNPNLFPFKNGNIENEAQSNLPRVKAITVNKVHGSADSIVKIQEKYNPDVESMEGAAFLYTAKIMDVDCIQLRTISNMVEPRNKDNWNLELSIDKLNKSLIKLLETQTAG